MEIPRRSCPVCNKCGSKKFQIIKKRDKEQKYEKDIITIQCLRCNNFLTI